MRMWSRLGNWLWHQPAILLALAVLFWSGNIVLGRAAADTVPPATLAEIRWFGSVAIALPFAWRALKRDWPTIRAHFGTMTVLAFTGITAYNTVAYWSLGFTEAINGSLMQTTAPVMIALWSLVLFGDRLTRNQAIGIVLAAAGVVTIITRGDPAILMGLSFNVGDLGFVFGLCFFAFYTAMLRKRPDIAPLSLLVFTQAWGATMLLPVAIVELTFLGRAIVPGPLAWFSFAYVMIFPALLAYICYNRGVALVGANLAGFAYFLFPVYGAILSVVFLGERVQLFHLIGTALILAGVAIAILRRARLPARTGSP